MTNAAPAMPGAPAAPRLVFWGDPALRRPCRPAAPGDPELPALAAAMWRVLLDRNGLGLAAPQVGEARRVIVIRDPRRGGRPERLVLVDPVIERRDPARQTREEGCLSFPGLYLRITRPRAVTVRYADLDGRTQRLAAEGLLACIVQHEVDHLDGIMFIDHLSAWRRRLLWWRLRQLAAR
ncbi:MAG: peptide deformylase [Candidatus Krumholzibacteriia bacterium]